MFESLSLFDYVLIALAAAAAGAINAIAGGGTLISFPALTAAGVPTVVANVTNTVALSPGYFGATLAQVKDLKGQERRLKMLAPAGALGGLLGGLLLLSTSEKLFRELVPFLILAASLLLAAQEPLRAWLLRRSERAGKGEFSEAWAIIPIFLAAIYGGYFGAGLSVIILAVLALFLNDNLTRLNGLKQAIAFSTNITAAVLFLFSGRVLWPVAAVMAAAALLGGSLGGRLAGQIKPVTLRRVVVVVGIIISIIYFIRG